MYRNTKLDVDLNQLIEELTPVFNAESTIKSIAVYLLTNKPSLTHDQMATIVQGIKHNYGQMANTAGSSIAWYKQDMKKDGNIAQTKSLFMAYLNKITEAERNTILLELANNHIEAIVKVSNVDEVAKYIPINDIPEDKPSPAQIAEARKAENQELEVAPEVAPISPESVAKIKQMKQKNKMKKQG